MGKYLIDEVRMDIYINFSKINITTTIRLTGGREALLEVTDLIKISSMVHNYFQNLIRMLSPEQPAKKRRYFIRISCLFEQFLMHQHVFSPLNIYINRVPTLKIQNIKVKIKLKL